VHSSIGEGNEAAIECCAKGITKNGATYPNNYLGRLTTSDGQIMSIRHYCDTHDVHRTLHALD
jgi:ketosteroid isomerase-like protein